MIGNSVGDIVEVVHETDTSFYYYDGLERWCYFFKDEELEEFEICEESDMNTDYFIPEDDQDDLDDWDWDIDWDNE